MRELIIATWEKRVINLLIDSMIVQFIYLMFLLFYGLIIIHNENSIGESTTIEFTNTLYFLILYILYYIIFEGLTGRTIGKYITRTKVVSDNGNKPSFSKIIFRSFSRILFIEVISFFSSNPVGWHDRFSGTKVVVTHG